jgi:large subunit ribosomal protein L29
MALLKPKDLRTMRPEDRRAKLKELNDDLMHERGVAAMGGAPASPGKMKALKKNIARILTVEREAELAEKGLIVVPQTKSEKGKSKAPRGRPERAEEAEDSDTENLYEEDQEEKK